MTQVKDVYYRHYTGGVYKLLGRGRLEADLTPVTIYESEDGEVWVRPTSNFHELVPNYAVKGAPYVLRFEKIENDNGSS